MTKITVADSFEPQTIDLLGTEYQTVPRTRSVTLAAQKLGETEGAVLDDENASPDAQVDYLARMLALRLKATTDGAPDAADHLRELWQEDRLSLDQLLKLIADLEEAEAGNPT